MAKQRANTLKESAIGLADALTKQLSKKYKDTPINIMQGGNADVMQEAGWVHTGCRMVDLAISNHSVGGYPVGKMTLITGPEQSGKSLMAVHAMATTLKDGGYSIYFDSERAMHPGFFKAIGIDMQSPKWQPIPQNILEVIFTTIEDAVTIIRSADKNVPITIVLDSLASCVTMEQFNRGYDPTGYDTGQSIFLSKNLPKLISLIADHNVTFIATNQVRYKLNPMPFESPWRMPGGQAAPHYASVILMLSKGRLLTDGDGKLKRVVGVNNKVQVEKNRLAPPKRKVEFDIFYDRGIDDYRAWIPYMKLFKIVPHATWIKYKYTDPDTGKTTELAENGAPAFAANILGKMPKVRDEIWQKICDSYIMEYAKSTEGMDVDISKEEILTDD